MANGPTGSAWSVPKSHDVHVMYSAVASDVSYIYVSNLQIWIGVLS